MTAHAQPEGLFRNAITEADGVSVNVGYLSLFWIMVVVLSVVPFMCGMAIFEFGFSQSCQPLTVTGAAGTLPVQKLVCFRPHTFNVQPLGIGIGAVTTAFAAALGALGLFLSGDRKPTPTPPTGEPM